MPDSNRYQQDWDNYWQVADGASAIRSQQNHQPLTHFWQQQFATRLKSDGCKLLDIACGSGVVSDIALKCAAQKKLHLHSYCTDSSPSALSQLKRQRPQTQVFVADMGQLPVREQSFDFVVSQFGIEYAPTHPFQQVANSIKPGGHFMALLHLQGSIIYQECQQSLQHIKLLAELNLFNKTEKAYQAGFECIYQGANKQKFYRADKALAPAINRLKLHFQQYGPHIAHGTMWRLFKDIGLIYNKLEAYQPDEVLRWLKAMQQEVAAYTGRMKSMLTAARTTNDIQAIQQAFQHCGFNLSHSQVLLDKLQQPLCWSLIAQRQH